MNDNNTVDSGSENKFVKATRAQKKEPRRFYALGQKVYDYRRDLLSDEDADNLEKANQSLKKRIGD